MPATSLNAADLSELGLTTEADLDAQDSAHLEEIAANDPFMADLLASMEQAKPTAEDLAKALRESPVKDDYDAPSDGADVAAELTPAEVDPLAKPGEVAQPASEDGGGIPDRAVAAVGEDPSAPATATGTAPTTISDTFIVDLGNGATASIDTPHAQRLLALEAWAAKLQQAPDLLNAMQAVENGQAVAVPAGQYEQFQVWLRGGQTAASPAGQAAPAAAPAPSATALPELDQYATDTERALYASVQQTQQELAALRAQQVDAARSQQSAAMEAHLASRAQLFEATFTAQAEEMGLSPAQLNEALTHASQTRLIQSVNDELAQRHPLTGAVIGESDPVAVARTTFERAVYQLPSLRDATINAQVQARLDSERASITSINQKKNRAASLSSAPTAATTSNRDPRSMSLQEREAGIAAELRAAMSA